MCAGKIINGSLKRNDPVLNHQERKLDREKASASEACVRTQPAGTDTDFGPMQLLPRAEGVSGGVSGLILLQQATQSCAPQRLRINAMPLLGKVFILLAQVLH